MYKNILIINTKKYNFRKSTSKKTIIIIKKHNLKQKLKQGE